jgi:hypothetical protein
MKQAKIATEILIVLIIVVFTASFILFLVKSGVVSVEEGQEVNFLNAEFIPVSSSSTLAIKDFSFCSSVKDFVCEQETEFNFGQEIHFLIAFESSVINNNVAIVENYNIRDNNEKIIFSSQQKEDFFFEYPSGKQKEILPFSDFFTVAYGEEGEYTLELLIDNPLLDKNIKLVETFTLYNTDELEYDPDDLELIENEEIK